LKVGGCRLSREQHCSTRIGQSATGSLEPTQLQLRTPASHHITCCYDLNLSFKCSTNLQISTPPPALLYEMNTARLLRLQPLRSAAFRQAAFRQSAQRQTTRPFHNSRTLFRSKVGMKPFPQSDRHKMLNSSTGRRPEWYVSPVIVAIEAGN
jgi:hypothetical protein